jgi:hypothetical protein
MSKVDRAKHGPGWGEVIFGAVLSLILGVVAGAVLMIIKPVIVAKEPPKEPVAGAIYYIEGLRGDSAKARQALVKRKAFVAGQSVKVTEDEINSLTSSAAAPVTTAAKPGEPAPAPAKTNEMLATGQPNVRVRNGVLQVAVPVTLNVLGFEQKIIAQARGGFEKNGETFVYDPREIYLGSCPVQRLPFVAGYMRQKVISSQKIPEDIAAAWAKLADVKLEGNTLSLVMP